MSKFFLWLTPTLFLVCCLFLSLICNILKLDFEIVNFLIFIVAVYGAILITPCFYIILINRYSNNFKSFICSILRAFGCIILNGIIVCYRSLMYYLGLKQRSAHELDFFPMYMIIPLVIVLVGLCVTRIVKLMKGRRKERNNE